MATPFSVDDDDDEVVMLVEVAVVLGTDCVTFRETFATLVCDGISDCFDWEFKFRFELRINWICACDLCGGTGMIRVDEGTCSLVVVAVEDALLLPPPPPVVGVVVVMGA